MAARDGARRSTGQVATASASADPSASPSPAKSAAAPAWKGKTIKRFRLVDELGEGAMGRVFVAEDTVLRRHVAMKLLPSKHRDGRPNLRTERLITEARSAATLEHPNVVTIHEVDKTASFHYIAMELAEGGNLERLVQMSGPMEVERACQLVAEAAEALAHAHKRGIVHRDIKPANLLLTRSGRCKVCDFGLAMVERPENDATKLRCVGTPYFIAPEIAMGRGATEKSDIYSLGCTLFFLLTGRPPFPGNSSRQVMKMHVQEPLPDLRRWRADLPQRLTDAINQACAKDPNKRFKDAEHFGAVLRTFTITTAMNGAGVAGAYVAPPLSGAPVTNGATLAGMHFSAAPASSRQGSSRQRSAGNGSAGHAPAFSDDLTPLSTINAPALMPPPLTNPAMSMTGQGQPKVQSPLVWAGAATLLTAALIALGMWLMRSGPEPVVAATAGAADVSSKPRAAASEPSLFALVKNTPDAAPLPSVMPVIPDAPPPVASTVNVLSNGTMEEADTDDGLMGWFIHPRFKPQAQILRENGNRFVRLMNDDVAKTVFVDQKIDVDPEWKSIRVSARMRATNFKAGTNAAHDGRVAFAFRDDAGTRVGNWPPVPNVRFDSGWVERIVTADVPPGATSLYVQLAIFNAIGTVDFDDVIIVPQK